MEQNPSWEANRFSASQEIPRILWNLKVHYRITSACHLSLTWASLIQSIPPHPTSGRSILVLFSHLCLSLLNGLFPSDFPTKTLYTPLVSPIHTTCPAHHIFGFITQAILGEEYRSLSSSLCSFLHSLVTLSLLGPYILFVVCNYDKNDLFVFKLFYVSEYAYILKRIKLISLKIIHKTKQWNKLGSNLR